MIYRYQCKYTILLHKYEINGKYKEYKCHEVVPMQCLALEKHRGADARPVVDAVGLDVEDRCGDLIVDGKAHGGSSLCVCLTASPAA